ncbi:MAG: IS66 family transposase [Chamaesiphon sp. CSU_1_12]|nr:IS66 family transposase [Chamaesiphon sp. CSU_1_12]
MISPEQIRAVYAGGEEAVVELVSGLVEQIAKLESRLIELEGIVKKNSSNSSKPPTSDGLGKKTKSLRIKVQNQTGGQPDHPGSTLEWSSKLDEIVTHQIHQCQGCGTSLTAEPVKTVWARQVYDIPPIELKVTEHQAQVKDCPHCGTQNQAEFPAFVTNVVQYGARLKSMMVYLMAGQLLPSARTCEILSDMVGVNVSEGTIFNTRSQCFEQLAVQEHKIKSEIMASAVVHFDETGMRVNGKLWWLHVACTDGLTYYFVHTKRGRDAIDQMGILPDFEGKAVHDGWKSYQDYECEHFLCNAHHLRELIFIWEQYHQAWAIHMLILLGSIKQAVDATRITQTPLATDVLDAFKIRYQTILASGLAANPPPPPLPPTKHRRKSGGRQKQSPARNLLERLHKYQTSVLGFMYDFSVPFDNNQAERDVRMVKLKQRRIEREVPSRLCATRQKISGTFRSESGAQMFCRIRGYISTLRKQGLNVFDAFISLFSGYPQSPLPQPE